MFKLPNNNSINHEALIDFMLDTNKNYTNWLDGESGECLLEEELIKKFGKDEFRQKKSKRFFQVPKISNFNRLQWMIRYISEIIEFEDKKLAEKLKDIVVSENPQINFIKTLQKTKDGWIYGWNSWISDNAFEEMKLWFHSLPIYIKEELEYFCDCPICQAMQVGQTSKEVLEDAFRETSFKNILKSINDNK